MLILRRCSTLAVIGAALLFVNVQSCHSPRVAPIVPLLPPLARLKSPAIRVGLGTDFRSTEINLRQKVQIYTGRNGSIFLGEATRKVVVELTAESLMKGLDSRHSVQIGSFVTAKDAEAIAQQVRTESSFKAFVTKGNQVRVGPFTSKPEAKAALDYLVSNGYPDGFIQEEASKESATRTFKLAFDDKYFDRVREGTVFLVPETNEPAIELAAKSYRGVFEVHLNTGNRLTIIDILNLEDYLRGVVPNELSPSSFPQIEALKAQAIAARTYALKNLGQFDGYDICATPACQVYEGASSETAMSDRAVEETAGEVAVYNGELINALYTSTCGGSTEAADKIFEGRGEPYLVPVACYPEQMKEYELRSEVPAAEDPKAFALALLRTLGVVDLTPADLAENAREDELAACVSQSIAACHRKSTDVEPHGISTIGPLATYIINRFGWKEKVDRLFIERDTSQMLGMIANVVMPDEKDRRSVAYLLSEKLLDVADIPVDGTKPLTRRQVVGLLYNVILSADDPRHTASFLKATGGLVTLEEGINEKSYHLAKNVTFFMQQGPAAIQEQRLIFIGGERVQFVPDSAGDISVLAVEQPQGLANDRSSRYYRWENRISRADLSARVARNYSVGELLDLQVISTGESNRVTELMVMGSTQNVTIRGIKIRWALGLRDSLFVIDRIYDSNGNIAAFHFSGKGWGHGVGLCQVGAYGLAMRGMNDQDILKTYYKGVEIVRRYWPRYTEGQYRK